MEPRPATGSRWPLRRSCMPVVSRRRPSTRCSRRAPPANRSSTSTSTTSPSWCTRSSPCAPTRSFRGSGYGWRRWTRCVGCISGGTPWCSAACCAGGCGAVTRSLGGRPDADDLAASNAEHLSPVAVDPGRALERKRASGVLVETSTLRPWPRDFWRPWRADTCCRRPPRPAAEQTRSTPRSLTSCRRPDSNERPADNHCPLGPRLVSPGRSAQAAPYVGETVGRRRREPSVLACRCSRVW